MDKRGAIDVFGLSWKTVIILILTFMGFVLIAMLINFIMGYLT